MANITLKGESITIIGELPAKSSRMPHFTLVKSDLSEISSPDVAGKKVILNIFPSLDTSVCAASVRRFNEEASKLDNTVVLCVSADLPFAHSRFCGAEGLEDVVTASVFRSPNFGEDYGVTITSGPLQGVLSRAVVVADEQGTIRYTEHVPEIAQEPDYEAAIYAVKQL